jgi:hypothetical protein
MKSLTKTLLAAVLVASVLPRVASAALILDTGVPGSSGFPLSLDGTDYVAAEFSLGAHQTITSILGYITGGNSGMAGDTFTVALYSASGSNGLPGRTANPVWSGQATFAQNGWNGLSNLSLSTLTAGNYWAAFEVGAADSTAGLLVPTGAAGGTSPALNYAFNANDGSGYQLMTGENFGVQVIATSPVPLPGALILFASGLLGLGGARKVRHLDGRRQAV